MRTGERERDGHRPPDASATTGIDLGEAKIWAK